MNTAVEQRRKPRARRDQRSPQPERTTSSRISPTTVGRRLVEISSRLIGKHERRPDREGSTDGDALLLAAGQLLDSDGAVR